MVFFGSLNILKIANKKSLFRQCNSPKSEFSQRYLFVCLHALSFLVVIVENWTFWVSQWGNSGSQFFFFSAFRLGLLMLLVIVVVFSVLWLFWTNSGKYIFFVMSGHWNVLLGQWSANKWIEITLNVCDHQNLPVIVKRYAFNTEPQQFTTLP